MEVVPRVILLLAAILALAGCNQSVKTQALDMVQEPFGACAETAVANRYIVRWKNGTTSVATDMDRNEVAEKIIEPNIDAIDFAEPDQKIRQAPPSDNGQMKAQATEDENWGQARTEVSTAWAQGIEGEGVIVAVIDSGADTLHAQLKGQLAVNEGEIPGNGKDDDGNGLIDDVNGYDFDARTGKVRDGTGHGTHVAGIILADHQAGKIKGMAPKAKLIPLDFMNDYGEGNISDAIEALEYAVKRGAKVVNASWGGAPCSLGLKKAIQDLEGKGVLFIAASGNGDRLGRGINLDVSPSYPAAFGLPAQITVGASTSSDFMAGFSNYSPHLVNILAPGVGILSTYPGNQTAEMDGTSMATPFVAGAAALLWSYKPNATAEQIKQALLAGVDKGRYTVSTEGRMNVRKAVEELAKLVP